MHTGASVMHVIHVCKHAYMSKNGKILLSYEYAYASGQRIFEIEFTCYHFD
jgi:hypothetical protein